MIGLHRYHGEVLLVAQHLGHAEETQQAQGGHASYAGTRWSSSHTSTVKEGSADSRDLSYRITIFKLIIYHSDDFVILATVV